MAFMGRDQDRQRQGGYGVASGFQPLLDWYGSGMRHIWLPYAQMKTASPPLKVARTEGSRIFLADGGDLVDGIASWWTACHGYNHPHIRDAVDAMMQAAVVVQTEFLQRAAEERQLLPEAWRSTTAHSDWVLDLTPERAQMDWWVIGDRADRNADAHWTASFATRSGTNTCSPVEGPVT